MQTHLLSYPKSRDAIASKNVIDQDDSRSDVLEN